MSETTTTTTTTIDSNVQDANQIFVESKVLFTHPCSGTGDRCDAISGCVKIDPTFGGNISIRYKPFVYTPEMSKVTRNVITLPRPLLNNDKQNILVSFALSLNEVPQSLNNENYTLNEDNISITINDNAYSNKNYYFISYIPGLEITHLLPYSEYSSQQIIIPSLEGSPPSCKVTFNYTFQDIKSLVENKYYSPICKNYFLTLS